MGMISQNISSDYKLVNFNVPKYLIENLDNMVRFKRMSRTSYLIQLIEQSLITEKKRIEEQGKLNFLIKDIEEKNRKILKNEMIGLQREIEEEFEPPVPPTVPTIEEPDRSQDNWNDPTGLSRLWNLR